MRRIKPPFFVVNPKNFLYGEDLLQLAKKADALAQKYNIDLLFTAPPIDLMNIVKHCPNLIVTAQHMDEKGIGDTMGSVTAEGLVNIGVKAVVLNHADYQLTISCLMKTINRTKKLGLMTIVCADSISEAKMIATLKPDIVLAEPTKLIGQEEISESEYVESTIEAIKKVYQDILVEQGAGIRTENDVVKLLRLGADGVGVTSGIIKARDPINMMEKMVRAVGEFKKEGES